MTSDENQRWFGCHDNKLHSFNKEPESGVYRSECGDQFIDEGILSAGGGFYECPIVEVSRGCEDCIKVLYR